MKRIGISAGVGLPCTIWCNVDKVVDGRTYFTVINGAWQGSIRDGRLRLEHEDEVSDTDMPAYVCWDAPIPKEHNNGYNAIIAYINQQLSITE